MAARTATALFSLTPDAACTRLSRGLLWGLP